MRPVNSWKDGALPRAALLAALAGCFAASAPALEILHTLPGVDARGAGWNAQGPWVISPMDLRRLRLDPGPGGLLLQERIEQPLAAVESLIGERLAAWRQANGELTLLDLETGVPSTVLVGISALGQGGQTILAAGAAGLWQARLDQADPVSIQHLGPFPAAPTALCGREGLAWLVAADTLQGYGLGDPPLPLGRTYTPGILRLAEHEDRLLACRGESGVTVFDLASPFVPVAWPWQPGFPVLDALWWREQVFVLAAGDSGLVLVDTADPGTPRLLGRWRTTKRAERLSLKGDSLLVAEGADGLSLHLLRLEAGSPRADLLARHATRPWVSAIQSSHGSQERAWMLDRGQGFRRFSWPDAWPFGQDPVETDGAALPLPVDGGDWRDGLIAGCRYGAGLRFYQETAEGIVLRGIHPTDPVKLLAWGPDDLIAYVTPQAFVAVKQANRSPWFLLHHGTINLLADPLCAAWTGDQRLFVGCADGRLFQLNAENPGTLALEQVLTLAGPVRSLSVLHEDDTWNGSRLAVAATKLYQLRREAGSWVLTDSLAAGEGRFSCVAINELWGLAGLEDPPRLLELLLDQGLQAWGEAGILPAAPTAVGRRVSDGSPWGACWAALDNGDLLHLAGQDEVAIDPAPARPGGLTLRAWPNPFNPETRLAFTLATPVEDARLEVFDLSGRAMARPYRGPLAAGDHEIALDASGWPSGLYFATLAAGPHRATTKLLLIR
ncbi:MAG: hypothetical protein Q8O14_00240 [bacterium]|nr:hypothetical protein [bacterium]